MHISTLLQSSLLLAGALAPRMVGAFESGADVIDLTTETFDKFVNEEGLKLVKFYAPWCGHCKALGPHYDEASTALKEKNIQLARINCDDNTATCQAHGVTAYPTLKVYKNGSETPYGGNRKADGIISYMVKQSLPAVTPVTVQNHEEFKHADKIVVVAYVNSESEGPAPAFAAAAETHRDDYLFGLSTDEAAIKAAGVTPPAVVIYKKFDEPRVDMSAEEVLEATAGSITAFIKSNSMPLFDEVSGENYQAYAASGKPLAYLFVDPTDQAELTKVIDELKPVAAAHKGKINFVWIDAVKFVEHGKSLGIKEGQYPALVIQDLQTQLKFPLDQEKPADFANVAAHAEAFVSGALEPKLKSEPVPEVQDEKYYKLVGSKFEEVIYQEDKDVFVQFSASWCGHCKRLLPTWETLSESFAADESIVLAKMDGELNDLPAGTPFQIQGFPTLKFKPAGSRQFIDYEGDRSLDDLLGFVAKWSKKEHTPVVPQEKTEETGSAARPAATHVDGHDEL